MTNTAQQMRTDYVIFRNSLDALNDYMRRVIFFKCSNEVVSRLDPLFPMRPGDVQWYFMGASEEILREQGVEK